MDTKDLKIVTSDAGEIGKVGLQRWVQNLLKFSAPLLIMYITFVSGRLQADGFQFQDFIPSQLEVGALILWVMNAVQDFLRKLTVDQAYIVEKK
jgi:hypothetical protein